MTRETKIGLAMVLLMAGVFGFLVYKRVNRPIDEGAETQQASTGADDAGTKEAKLSLDDEEDFAPPKRPEILPVAGQARPISLEEPADDEPEFGRPESVTERKPARPQMPTMVADDEETSSAADDPFAADSPAADSTMESTPAMTADQEPESAVDDPFSADEDNSSETTTSVKVEEPAGPAFGFESMESVEAVEETPADETPEKPAVIEPEIVTERSRPTAAPTFGEIEPVEEEEEEDTVSLRARAKIPESAFLEEELPETAQSLEEEMPATEPLSAPALSAEDSEDDRYGGYRAMDIVEVEEQGDSTVEVVRETATARGSQPPRFASREDSQAARKHIVKSNETFWSISQKYYGTGRYFNALAAYNLRQIPDPTKMKPGVEIALPSGQELEHRYPNLLPKGQDEPGAADSQANQAGELFTGQDGRPLYRIGAKDTLSGIAQAHLGRASRWVQILEMNRDVLKDGNSLKIGMVLRLPHDARQSQVTQPSSFFR
ncbi:MAG: LysM peptidoglycan-binding domain-containing protein [Planctomycetaceae bacterium]